MRLHIVPDEKIINRCINSFETVYPGDNKYIVITSNPQDPRFVKGRAGVFFTKHNSKDFWYLIGDVNQYSAIIVHYLRETSAEFICKINHSNIYWIEWGVDLYGYMLYPKGYRLYYDKDIIWKCSNSKLPRQLYNFLYLVKSKIRSRKYLRAAKRVKYFVPDSMYDEYPLLLSYYPELNHLEYREFFYYPIDEILGSLLECRCSGNSIMVGNSASLTGNHLHAFELLKKLDISDRQVLVPLSYGVQSYADYVIKEGQDILGSSFSPITSYLPLDKYNEVLLSANIFIYCNLRQEAVGNILIALYLGGKVFLEKDNPLLPFYKNLGLTLFSTSDLSQKSIDEPLSEECINENRRILASLYSRERQLSLIRNNF